MEAVLGVEGPRAEKLDFRFADEEDATEIADLVQVVGRLENEAVWLKAGTERVTAAAVSQDCSSSKSRWIVLETPAPEETMVAAVRLSLVESERRCVIDVICALGEQFVVYNQLLARVENVARGMGIVNMVIEVVQWNEPMYEWLCSCGYQDQAGREYKVENLLKPTMLLDMHKDLTSTMAAVGNARADLQVQPESLDDLLDGLDLSSVEQPEGAQVGGMETLMANLFVALHKEYSSP
jgi:hypothetical protein